ncbi:hypothetical protein R3P38DRAFT_2888231 [Favolaschia claudopus]|uniref:Secreted protein n=1 Tax=Favolaschia claudopus TaxID=2862362 RepID=A0AAW0CSE2_9AGAR
MYNFVSFATVISALILAVVSIPIDSVPASGAAVSNVPVQKATATTSVTPAHATDVLQPLVSPLSHTSGDSEPPFNEAEAHPRARGGQCIVA